MSILYPIILIALGLFSVVVLPIMLVIFFLGIAGLAASIGKRKTKTKLSQKLQTLTVAEKT